MPRRIPIIIGLGVLMCSALCCYAVYDFLLYPQYLVSLVVVPSNPTAVYIGTHSGKIFKSTDGGEHWNHVFTGRSGEVGALWIDPRTPLFLIDEQLRGGASTRDLNTFRPRIATAVVDPLAPIAVYTRVGGDRFKTNDGGTSWSESDELVPLGYRDGEAFFDPAAPGTLYGYRWEWNDGVYRTTDGGMNWVWVRLPNDLLHSAMVIDPTAPSTLYAATGGAGVFKSTNGGRDWSKVNNGLCGKTYCPDLRVLGIDPQTPTILYAGGTDGIYKSADGGEHWRHLVFRVMPWE